MAELGTWLRERHGPLPGWGWLVVGGVGAFGAYLMLRGRKSGATTVIQQPTAPTDLNGLLGGGGGGTTTNGGGGGQGGLKGHGPIPVPVPNPPPAVPPPDQPPGWGTGGGGGGATDWTGQPVGGPTGAPTPPANYPGLINVGLIDPMTGKSWGELRNPPMFYNGTYWMNPGPATVPVLQPGGGWKGVQVSPQAQAWENTVFEAGYGDRSFLDPSIPFGSVEDAVLSVPGSPGGEYVRALNAAFQGGLNAGMTPQQAAAAAGVGYNGFGMVSPITPYNSMQYDFNTGKVITPPPPQRAGWPSPSFPQQPAAPPQQQPATPPAATQPFSNSNPNPMQPPYPPPPPPPIPGSGTDLSYLAVQPGGLPPAPLEPAPFITGVGGNLAQANGGLY
jgi:hypothetical protein